MTIPDLSVVKAAVVELLRSADAAHYGGPQHDPAGHPVPYDHLADALLAANWLTEAVRETSAAVVHEIAKQFSQTSRPHMAGWLAEVAIALSTGRAWPVLEPKPSDATEAERDQLQTLVRSLRDALLEGGQNAQSRWSKAVRLLEQADMLRDDTCRSSVRLQRAEPEAPVAADPPLRHAPDADLGRIAYLAYVRSVAGVSVAGDPLPTWAECKPHIAAAWAQAAKAAVSAVFMGKDIPPTCAACGNRPATLDGFCDPCIDRCHESTELQHSCAVCRADGDAPKAEKPASAPDPEGVE